jgi:hypothetical protein
MLKDADIRQALHRSYVKRMVEAEPMSLVVDELGLMEGKYRIDVAVVGGKMHGFEIKSGADRLDRLPAQQESFGKVFDCLNLVVDESHVEAAVKIVPPCWGLIVASVKDGSTHLDEIWPSRQNYDIDPYVLSQLLWRDEALSVLRQRRLALGMWKKPRKALWRKLASELDIDDLRQVVRQTLKHRRGWR